MLYVMILDFFCRVKNLKRKTIIQNLKIFYSHTVSRLDIFDQVSSLLVPEFWILFSSRDTRYELDFHFIYLFLSHNSTRIPLVLLGCKKAILAPPAPYLGSSSINLTPPFFNFSNTSSMLLTLKAIC